MSKGYTLSSTSSPVQTVLRALFMIVAAIGGFFIFAASAAFAMFVILGLVIIGVIVFSVLWLRAKITGKPIVPGMKMYGFQTFGSQQNDAHANAHAKPNAKRGAAVDSDDASGPVLDAHETPDGWSVDTE